MLQWTSGWQPSRLVWGAATEMRRSGPRDGAREMGRCDGRLLIGMTCLGLLCHPGRVDAQESPPERKPPPSEKPTEKPIEPGAPRSRPGEEPRERDSVPATDAPGARGRIGPLLQRARSIGEMFSTAMPDSVREFRLPTGDSLATMPVVPCMGQPVRSIRVRSFGPYTDRLREGFAWFGALVQGLHVNTRADVVRGFLQVREGEPCTEFARRESERVLRTQPFLVDARVVAHDDGNGGVILDVSTRDEFSGLIEVSTRSQTPLVRGVRFGETNLGGAGRLLLLDWRDGGAYNDRVGVRYQQYLVAGRPNVLSITAGRDPRGHSVSVDLVRPYLTDLQRFAWRAAVFSNGDYVGLRRPLGEANALQLTRRAADLAGVRRFGDPGSLWLGGAMFTWEQNVTDVDRPVLLRPEGFVPDTAGPFPIQFRNHTVARVNLLGGYRRVRFVQAQGFDALTGVQDLRLGFQGGVQIGRSLPMAGLRDNDWFAAGGLYWGDGGPRSFIGAQLHAEGRRDVARDVWNEVVSGGRVAWYLKPWMQWLTQVGVEWSAGWSPSIPFQLSFANVEGGVRGYGRSQDVGGQRLIGRFEHRWVPPRALTAGDIGLAVFSDVGLLASGDVPYARGDARAASVGFSVLATAPRRSRRVWRVDVAYPLTAGLGNKGVTVRLISSDRTRVFWRDPRDLLRVRDQSVPESLFNWP
jgi:hypothetical protein